MKLYWVKNFNSNEDAWYERFEATLSKALAHAPQNDADRASQIWTFELAEGLPRRDLMLGILNRTNWTKPKSATKIRVWNGKKWVKPGKGDES